MRLLIKGLMTKKAGEEAGKAAAGKAAQEEGIDCHFIYPFDLHNFSLRLLRTLAL